MSHCYGYDSMSDLWEAGRKEREKKAEQREIDTLKARIRELEAENAELRNKLKAAKDSV